MSANKDVIIIGAGMSGIGMAVQLVRKFGTRNFEIIEKSEDVGGTWFANSYPGCGCDVPSHFYSYSFAMNPNWSMKYALQPEIHAYFKSVAQRYDIIPHIRYRSTVEKAEWDTETATWLVTIKDGSGRSYQQRCKFFVSAVGGLSTPKKCDIPGAEKFRGRLFHSAQWDHNFDYKGKEVVVIGNGCSATQFVPIISDGVKRVKKVTQFSRQAHWLAERANPTYSTLFKVIMRYVPGAMLLYRFWLYALMERDFAGFYISSGAKVRKGLTQVSTDYIRKQSPAQYRDALVPKTVIGCKRKVNDTDYLACLHRENVELVHDDPVKTIAEEGVFTKSGRFVRSDAIVLANGFETQKLLFPMEIVGENGITVSKHWDKVSSGSSQAYMGTCLTDFPNFFILMGPNTISGHLSVIYTVECQIGFALRLMRPVLRSLHPSLFSKMKPSEHSDAVVVKGAAEQSYNDWLQAKARQLVWATGCTSWFIDEKTGKNTQMFPDWQFNFWWRSILVRWEDFIYSNVKSTPQNSRQSP